MSIRIIPYQQDYDQQIWQLEEEIVQGKQVRLKIIKEHFLDRSAAFCNYFPCLAIDEKGSLVGTSIGAQTEIMVNGNRFSSGFGYDVKVHPACRNKGVGKLMAKYIYQNFFKREGFQKNFITLKLSNAPVIKLTAKAVGKIWLYGFVYLTIPAKARVTEPFTPKQERRFSVTCFHQDTLSPAFYRVFSGGLGCFYTHQLYRLKIEKISWLFKQGLKVLKTMKPQTHALLPKEKEVMEFATLYNHTEDNISHINEVLEHLEKGGKRYLLVCCQKGDSIYRYLKNHSINSYDYYMLTDFSLYEKDNVTIDVRCL